MPYYIENGVRRSVAACELGLSQMIARLHEVGKPPRLIGVSVSELNSPKLELVADQRYRRLVRLLSTLEGRATIAKYSPIDVQVLGADLTQANTVPLKDVLLIPESP